MFRALLGGLEGGVRGREELDARALIEIVNEVARQALVNEVNTMNRTSACRHVSTKRPPQY